MLLWCARRLSVDFAGMPGCAGLHSDGRTRRAVCLAGIVIGHGAR